MDDDDDLIKVKVCSDRTNLKLKKKKTSNEKYYSKNFVQNQNMNPIILKEFNVNYNYLELLEQNL